MKIIYEGRWVIDSNIFVYATDDRSAHYEAARMLFRRALDGEFQPVVAQQNIVESEHVLIQAYKQKSIDVLSRMEEILINFGFSIIIPKTTTYQRFHGLLKIISGRFDFFDYYLAATMLDNGIANIFTDNAKDFSMIPGIRAVNPLLPPQPRK